MSTKNPLPRQIINSLHMQVEQQLELAKAIKHPGENGRARENTISEFIKKIVPKKLGVDTGFVIDGTGATSKQVDIVIYHADSYPIFEIGGIKHFLVESVVAVVENKARITGQKSLDQALENIKSVKKLDRSGSGRNYFGVRQIGETLLDRNKYTHQIFGIIVSQNSMETETLKDHLSKFVSANDKSLWFNLYVDVSSFTISYCHQRQANDTAPGNRETVIDWNPYAGEYLSLSHKEDSKGDKNLFFIPPMGDLAQALANVAEFSLPIGYRPTDYMYLEQGGQQWLKI